MLEEFETELFEKIYERRGERGIERILHGNRVFTTNEEIFH